ncbi:MAG TPA: hypothetical protein VKE69_07610 [Planctomycetota bacterium]|nr:hypothetical protein [Planctomycetota bacterium]
MEQTLVTDLLVTDAFLIKGSVEPKPKRFFNLLDEWRSRFITVRDATLIDLRNRNTIRTPRILVNMERIVLAHEFIDTASDRTARALAQDRKLVSIRAFHVGAVNFELAGQVRPGSYEPSEAAKRFFVMERPSIRGIDVQGREDELALLTQLDYVIVARDRLSYIYDFNE